MKRAFKAILVTMIMVGLPVFVITLYVVRTDTRPVHAAPVAKYQEPGCEPLGTVGNIIVARCVDEVGNVVFANSSGFMAVVP